MVELTKRERDICERLDLTVPEIAVELGIGHGTVRTVLQNVYRKFGVSGLKARGDLKEILKKDTETFKEQKL